MIVDFLPNRELLLVRLHALEPRLFRCFSQRRAVAGGMLTLERRAIEPTEAPFSLKSKASKKRVRLIVSYLCLLGVLGGVAGGILSCFDENKRSC